MSYQHDTNDYGFKSGKEFVAACRKVLELYGEDVKQWGGTQRRFKDLGLEIESREGQELVIEYTYLRKNGGTLNNPVIMVGKDGEIFRCHGEWTYGRQRVWGYLNDPVTTKLAAGLIESHYAHQD